MYPKYTILEHLIFNRLFSPILLRLSMIFVCFLFMVLVYSELLFLSVGLLLIFHIRAFFSFLWLLIIFLYLRVGKLKHLFGSLNKCVRLVDCGIIAGFLAGLFTLCFSSGVSFLWKRISTLLLSGTFPKDREERTVGLNILCANTLNSSIFSVALLWQPWLITSYQETLFYPI